MKIRFWNEEKKIFTYEEFGKNAGLSTGYFDKNKKEIFVGDIVGWVENDSDEYDNKVKNRYLGILEYHNINFVLQIVDTDNKYNDWKHFSSFCLDEYIDLIEEFIVIGNIFEDTDILKLYNEQMKEIENYDNDYIKNDIGKECIFCGNKMHLIIDKEEFKKWRCDICDINIVEII